LADGAVHRWSIAQQPAGHDCGVHWQVPLTHACPAAQGSLPPHEHLPLTHESEVVASHVAQVLPGWAQSLTEGLMQAICGEQQPWHDLLSHTQAPLSQRWPRTQAGPLPQAQPSGPHPSERSSAQAAQAPPAADLGHRLAAASGAAHGVAHASPALAALAGRAGRAGVANALARLARVGRRGIAGGAEVAGASAREGAGRRVAAALGVAAAGGAGAAAGQEVGRHDQVGRRRQIGDRQVRHGGEVEVLAQRVPVGAADAHVVPAAGGATGDCAEEGQQGQRGAAAGRLPGAGSCGAEQHAGSH
jgi:hypothetical protein